MREPDPLPRLAVRGGRRRWVLALVLVASLFAGTLSANASSGQVPTTLTPSDELEPSVIEAINELRRSRGLRALAFSRELGRAAEEHALSMARLGYFSHTSANGGVFWRRIGRFYSSRTFARWTVGENLLWSSPDVSPERAVEMWLESPSHKEILLHSAWREIGLAAVHVTGAPGTFRGLDVTIVVADFGARS